MKPDWLIGEQEPRLSSVPDGDTARGDQAVEFVRAVGMTLYPWQEDLLRDMCRTDEDGLWSAREVVVSLARQNGKGEVLVARELAGVYLFGEKQILHTAHFLDTAIDAAGRLWSVIEDNESLMLWWADESDDMPKLIKSNGKDAIHFPNGARVRFRTRTKKTGRGLSIDYLVFDECFDLPNEVYAAMNNTTKARPNAQKIFISSPVNRYEHMHGSIFSAKRWAGVDGSPGVLFKEWSPGEDADPFDVETWKISNPSLVSGWHPGAQLVEIENEARAAKASVDLRESFLVETLGIGNWVSRDDEQVDFEPIIDFEDWARQFDEAPVAAGDSCMAVDVTPDGETVGLVSAVKTERGVFLSLAPVVSFDRDRVVRQVAKTVEVNDPVGVVLDPKGATGTLVNPLMDSGVEPELVKWTQVTQALELFLTMFSEGKIWHDGNHRWIEALKVAQFREGNTNGRALTRRDGCVAELVAATFAVWGLQEFGSLESVPEVKRTRRYVGKARGVKARRSVASMKF